ncbi:MAG: DUF3494 domain-containing protein [Polaromonas sp.]|uniref:ice-binding family protein n=1 Tax=Polaromonas sp. TaxID=1869339 RepID=UPI001795458B|nr:ice-binding family protein [Polaromonas sp.]NMM11283.1 DUF3494 domain-containing protein [Polaromonas sp.]
MNRFKSYCKRLVYLIPLVLTAFVAGCGGGSDNNAALLATGVGPTVTTTTPANTATNVPVNRKLTATFSNAIDPATITTDSFTVTAPGGVVISGTVTLNAANNTAIFAPVSALPINTKLTATITTGVKDGNGRALASAFVWTFTTGATLDTTVPSVTSTSPVDAATGVPINRKISAIFDEAMDPSTITSATFSVTTGPSATPVAGVVTYVGTTAIFTPTGNLALSTTYKATITTGATNLAIPAKGLPANVQWSFTTADASLALAKGPAPVVLGTAGDFVILAKSGVSTTGTTAVTGNIGLSPAAETFLTGFSLTRDPSNQWSTSSLVTGRLYAADLTPPTPSNLTTAVSNMETAYTDAAGRSLPDATELGAGNISGMTLVPGLYKWGTGVLMASNITLSGGANDVWIFQIAQDLTVGNGVMVTLSGGAQAKNIFWQVAGQATLGTTADFKGTILSKTLIALQTGAVMNGRALAQTAVTLDANAVTKPAL